MLHVLDVHLNMVKESEFVREREGDAIKGLDFVTSLDSSSRPSKVEWTKLKHEFKKHPPSLGWTVTSNRRHLIIPMAIGEENPLVGYHWGVPTMESNAGRESFSVNNTDSQANAG